MRHTDGRTTSADAASVLASNARGSVIRNWMYSRQRSSRAPAREAICSSLITMVSRIPSQVATIVPAAAPSRGVEAYSLRLPAGTTSVRQVKAEPV